MKGVKVKAIDFFLNQRIGSGFALCLPATHLPPLGKAVTAGFVVGVCVALWLPVLLPWALCWGLLLVGLSGWIWSGRWRGYAALLTGLAWAALQAGWVLNAQLPQHLEGRDVEITGKVVSLPEVETRRTRFRFQIDNHINQPKALRGKSVQLIWHDDFTATQPGPRMALHAGSRWQLQVRLRAPRGLANPGGFDAEKHALAQRVVATGAVRAKTQVLAEASGLQAWRETMAQRIASTVDSPSARYIQALAVGDTRALTDADWQWLRATGLTHLVAISGFHVGMVAGGVALLAAGFCYVLPWLGRICPRPLAAALVAWVAAIIYAAVAGFALPTVRTVLMITVVVVARLLRRRIQVAGSLALAALVIVAVDPLSVLAAGFWLSFAGVAWLIGCLPERSHWLSGFLSAQMVASIGLLPLTVMLFSQASAAGPLANLLAIPWWTLVVVPLSLIGTALEALWLGSGQWAWHCAATCFELSLPPLDGLAHSRFALWWLPQSPWFALPLALVAALCLLLPRGVPGKPLALLLWLPLLYPARQLPKYGELHLIVLDVGQGLSILVRTAQHQLLYDTGPAVRDGFDAGERVVVPALRALGVRQLDRIIISHGDNDHAGGAQAVAAVFPITHWHVPPEMKWPTVAQTCHAGQQWQWDGVRFTFLHPDRHFPYLRNESSCVLRIESAYGAVLLTGDIGQVIEQRLLKSQPSQLQAKVVLAPHHGSAGSSHWAFIEATDAQLALISAGYNNRFAHPRPEVVQRWQQSGAEVLNTAHSGALWIWLDTHGLTVREQRIYRARLWDASVNARHRAAQ